MPGSFTIVGEHGKKIPLEQQFHRCPRCTHPSSVQLTRSEKQLIIFNKQISKSSNMRVRYECKLCGWKNETLPDDPNELPPQHDDWYDDNGGNDRPPLSMGGRASEKQ